MKKKLNILCLLMFIILAADVACALGVVFKATADAFTAAGENPEMMKDEGSDFVTVSLLPVDLTGQSAFKNTDSATGKTCEAWPTNIVVAGEFDHGLAYYLPTGLSTVAVTVSGIIAIISFVRFIISVNRNEVFTRKTVGHLRKVGWMFIIMCAGEIIGDIPNMAIAASHIHLNGYFVNYADIMPFKELIFAVFTLIMAEAFSIGVRMKEEQELTI